MNEGKTEVEALCPVIPSKTWFFYMASGENTCGLCMSLTPISSPSLHLQDPWQQLALLVGVWEPKACRELRQLLTPVLKMEVEHLKCLPKDQGSVYPTSLPGWRA